MQYRKLGTTGLDVSAIGLGTWQLGGEWGAPFEQREADAIFDEAAACGVNLLDTAECYGDHLSESLIGNYLSRRTRSDWIVATKFGHTFYSFMKRSWNAAPAHVLQQLEDSLRTLRTDYIDIYQYHSGPNADFDNDELWEALDRAKQSGKIRCLGVSVAKSGDSFQAQQARLRGIDVIQVVYNRLERKAEEAFFPWAAADQLGVLARVPLASGILSGKYRPGARFAEDDVRSTYKEAEMERLMLEAEKIQQTEVPADTPMAVWALAWCLRHPAVTSVIPGAKSAGQVRLNAAAADAALISDGA